MDTTKFELTVRGVLMVAYGIGLKREQIDYDSLVSKVLSLFEPVELEALGDGMIVSITDELCSEYGISWGDWSGMTQRKIEEFIIDVYERISQATTQYNQSKGQIFRLKEG